MENERSAVHTFHDHIFRLDAMPETQADPNARWKMFIFRTTGPSTELLYRGRRAANGAMFSIKFGAHGAGKDWTHTSWSTEPSTSDKTTSD